jgi:Flp pilus assembly protein TadG
MRRFIHKLGRTDGAEIAEAALVLPLVFMFLLGIIWFGRAFNIYSTITQAAERGAVLAARPTCATCASPGDNWLGTNFAGNNTVANAVYSVTDASNLDRTLITANALSPTFCVLPPPAPVGTCSPSTGPITICRSVFLNSPSTPAQCGVIVSFKYPFQFYFPFTSLNLQRITLTAHAQSRMEY